MTPHPLPEIPPELLPIAERIGLERVGRVRKVLAGRLGSVVAIAECVRRRHNASAVLRSCEVFGVHEVHLVTTGFKASPGASRHAERWVRLRRFDTTEASIADLRARGFRVYVADVLPGAVEPEEVPVDKPVALLFGSEFTGVSDEARALADGAVRIPMHGLTQSLNVSVSAAILLRVVSERVRAIRGPDLAMAEQVGFLSQWLAGEDRARAGLEARTEPYSSPSSPSSPSSSSDSSSSEGSGGP